MTNYRQDSKPSSPSLITELNCVTDMLHVILGSLEQSGTNFSSRRKGGQEESREERGRGKSALKRMSLDGLLQSWNPLGLVSPGRKVVSLDQQVTPRSLHL